METVIWAILLLTTSTNLASPTESMKCTYGERGSQTATCFNANSQFIINTAYKFDFLDATLKCLNCTLSTIYSRNFDRYGNQLKNVDLRNSKIEEIETEGFVGLVFLENLNLSFNKIKYIYQGTFKGIQMVKTLDLSQNKIVTLQKGCFENLKYLKFLDLKFNVIEIIDSNAFSGLYKLIELDLNNNKIREIKKYGFANLTSLEILNLEKNNMKSLEDGQFSNLASLLELNLANNELTSLRIDPKPDNCLRRLFLRKNEISTVSGLLNGLHSLEQLDVSNNIIREIGQKHLQGLLQLRALNLSYNRLTIFRTGTFTSLPHLEILNCSHNHINDIKITGVQLLNSLHTLDLSFNSLNDLDYVGLISKMPSLSYLRVEDNDSLPCHLGVEMKGYFSEDNFQFVLYDPNNSFFVCINKFPIENITKSDTSFTTSETAIVSN